MSKKDFTQDSEVFDSMFSTTTIKEVNKQKEEKNEKLSYISSKENKTKFEKKEETKTIEVKPISSKIADEIITSNENKKTPFPGKGSRYNFYADLVLEDYLSNIIWIKRTKGLSSYFNSLILNDLLETLKLPKNSTNEEIKIALEKYKEENNL